MSRAISMTEQLPATANCQGPMNRQETQGGLCPRCQGELRFWLKLPSISHEEGTHRVYRCELATASNGYSNHPESGPSDFALCQKLTQREFLKRLEWRSPPVICCTAPV